MYNPPPHLFWFELVGSVPMSQSPVVSLSPRVQLSIGSDGRTVATPTSYLLDVLALKLLNHLGTVITPVRSEEGKK